MFRSVAVALACVLLFGACGEKSAPSDVQAASGTRSEHSPHESGSPENGGSAPADEPSTDRPDKIDPRKNGFEIGLGEWAVTPEAPALRPGRVTFVITNHGTMEHGFEIGLEGDSSGSGSGDLFKAESRLLKPGETTRMTVELSEGIHKIECLVEGHDDMGMEGPLDVRKNAPLIRDEGEKSSSNKVEIKDFGFSPDSLTVVAGTKVLWTNEDPTPHTVTSDNDAFDSDVLEPGDTFSFTFAKGIYKYACNIHPDMVGTVTVE